MSTFVHEEMLIHVRVFHNRKVVWEKTLDYGAPVEELRRAREEANRYADILKKEHGS